MLVDAEMCDSQLQLLFTLLSRGRERGLRSDIMVALGDMAVRFPNCIEPWTEHLYSALQDPDSGWISSVLNYTSKQSWIQPLLSFSFLVGGGRRCSPDSINRRVPSRP